MPIPVVSPKPLSLLFRLLPLLEHDTSYLAASDKMLNFSRIRSQFKDTYLILKINP